MLRIAADRSPIRIPSYRVILSEVEGSAAVLSEIVRSSLLSIPQSRVILSEARLGPRERRESSVG
jgi:hypothetical protein